MKELKQCFAELNAEAEKLNFSHDRITLLNLIKIEASFGLPFADKLLEFFPELVSKKQKGEKR